MLIFWVNDGLLSLICISQHKRDQALRKHSGISIPLFCLIVLIVSFYEFGRHLCLCNKMKGKWCVVDALLIAIVSRCIQIVLRNYTFICAKSSNCQMMYCIVLNIQMGQNCWGQLHFFFFFYDQNNFVTQVWPCLKCRPKPLWSFFNPQWKPSVSQWHLEHCGGVHVQ